MSIQFITKAQWSQLEAAAGKTIFSDCVTVRSGQKYALIGSHPGKGSELVDVEFTATLTPATARPVTAQRSNVPAPTPSNTRGAAVRAAAHAAVKTNPAPVSSAAIHCAPPPVPAAKTRSIRHISHQPAVARLAASIRKEYGI